jgi:hypothetical protein
MELFEKSKRGEENTWDLVILFRAKGAETVGPNMSECNLSKLA